MSSRPVESAGLLVAHLGLSIVKQPQKTLARELPAPKKSPLVRRVASFGYEEATLALARRAIAPLQFSKA